MAETNVPLNLAEHQSMNNFESTSPMEYEPTPEEKQAIKLVNKIFEKNKNYRKKYDEKWLDYYKMFRGKQWKEARPSYRHSEVFNMIFQMIQSDVPIQMDSRPKFEFVAQEPDDMEFAKIMNEVAESDWDRNNWLFKFTEQVYDSRFYGHGLGTCDYDPKANFGLGDIFYKSYDPFYFYPDPDALDCNERCNNIVLAEPISVESVKRDYPDKAQYIKPDLIDLIKQDKTNLDQIRFKSPVDNATILEGSSPYDLATQDKCLKLTLLIHDQEFVEEEQDSNEIDEATGIKKKIYIQKMKYPKGRKICIASGVLLDDKPLDYEDGKFPFFKLINYILPREFYGVSEIEPLESPQKTFNKIISFTMDVMTLMGNPIWIIDDTAMIDTDNLFNRPGLIVEKAKGSEVRREEGTQLQPYVLQVIDRVKLWFDDISGNNDVTRGATQGVSAASAISQLQEAAKTRTRQKSRNMDAGLQNFGQLYMGKVLQFRTAPQMYRLTNNENVNKYFKFHIQNQLDPNGNPILDEKGDPVRQAIVQNFTQDPNTGAYKAGKIRNIPIKGMLDVKVSTGSSLPFAKQQRQDIAKFAFQAGAIDEPALLEAIEYPNWQSVWQRVQERRAQAQQAQGGGQPPAPQGAPPPPQQASA